MKHTITLREKDYLTYQLYEYSTNPLHTFKRKRDYLVLIVLGVVFTLASYSSSDQVVFYVTAFLTAIWILFGKNYLRWRKMFNYQRSGNCRINFAYTGFG